MDRRSRVPAETHRVAKHHLRLRRSETDVLAAMPAVAVQSVDVVGQTEQLTARVSQFQLQQVSAALDTVHTLHNVNHAHQCKLPTGGRIMHASVYIVNI